MTEFHALCSFQAYLICLIVAYSNPFGQVSLVNDTAVKTLQGLAFRAAKTGLSCEAEHAGTGPTWESWIVASAKRRTVLIIYFLISVSSSQGGLSSFLFDELGDTFAPESKALWEASDVQTWTRAYKEHMAEWNDGAMTISELLRPEERSTSTMERRRRWVQSKDEFGMILFSVFAHLHEPDEHVLVWTWASVVYI